MVNQNNIKKTNEKVKVGNRNAVLYIGQRGGKYIKVKGQFVKYNNKMQNGKGIGMNEDENSTSRLPTLKSLAKEEVKKQISQELLYANPTPERKQELKDITELLRLMDTREEVEARKTGLQNMSARIIQNKWRSFNNAEMNVIVEPSVIGNIRGLAEYKIAGRKFRLSTDNFNFFDYLRPNIIESITYEGNNVIKIELDRHKIRHWARQYILIDLNNRTITWYNTSPDGNFANLNNSRVFTNEMQLIIL